MEQQASPVKAAMNFGLISGLAAEIAGLIYYVLDVGYTSPARYFTFIFVVGGIILAQINHKKDLGGYVTYARCLGVGVMTAIFYAMISILFQYVFMTFIDPDMITKIVAEQERAFIEAGMTDEQIDQALSMSKSFQTPGFMLVTGLLSGVFLGFIISLITSIFIQKEDPAKSSPMM